MLELTRFILDAEQLGAALALAGIRPAEHSKLPDLQSPAEPISQLRNTPILSDSGQQLSDEGAETLRLAADPARMLSCIVNVAGEKRWRELLVLHAEEAEGPFVVLEIHDEKYDNSVLRKLLTLGRNLLDRSSREIYSGRTYTVGHAGHG